MYKNTLTFMVVVQIKVFMRIVVCKTTILIYEFMICAYFSSTAM